MILSLPDSIQSILRLRCGRLSICHSIYFCAHLCVHFDVVAMLIIPTILPTLVFVFSYVHL